jgi:hypothetical protein
VLNLYFPAWYPDLKKFNIYEKHWFFQIFLKGNPILKNYVIMCWNLFLKYLIHLYMGTHTFHLQSQYSEIRDCLWSWAGITLLHEKGFLYTPLTCSLPYPVKVNLLYTPPLLGHTWISVYAIIIFLCFSFWEVMSSSRI